MKNNKTVEMENIIKGILERAKYDKLLKEMAIEMMESKSSVQQCNKIILTFVDGKPIVIIKNELPIREGIKQWIDQNVIYKPKYDFSILEILESRHDLLKKA